MLLNAHADWFEYFGALVRTEEGSVPPFFGPYLNYVRRYPLGVVGQITPFNHPLLIAIKKLAPALAAGNSVVLKPSELAPITVLELGRIAQEVWANATSTPLLLSLHCYFRSTSIFAPAHLCPSFLIRAYF
jgi:acyl-CoA reductase-like NAD-dependent aldehyde dehydrogenase